MVNKIKSIHMSGGQSYYVGLNADHDGSEVTEIINEMADFGTHRDYVFLVMSNETILATIINFPVIVKYEDK